MYEGTQIFKPYLNRLTEHPQICPERAFEIVGFYEVSNIGDERLNCEVIAINPACNGGGKPLIKAAISPPKVSGEVAVK